MNLKLAGNQLQIIPIEIGNLRSLRHLDLSNNQLQVLPVEIGNLEALQTLGLPGNQLQALPAEIGNLRSLVHLYFTDSQVYNRHFRDRSQSSLVAFLSNNQPQTARDVSFSILHQSHNVPGIPAKLVEINATGLTDLTDPELAKSLVDFYRYLPNEITANGPTSGQAQEIQDWMKQSEAVRNCKKLDLSGIGLTQLPKEIGLFVNLKELNLAFNRLKGVPAEIGGLASLEGLNLFSNQLQAIPVEIGNLGSLKYLDLSYNKLQSLPIIREIAEKLGTLDHLQLGFNEFEGLPDEFGHLRRTVIQGYYERKHVWL
jgi:Leucine-rich repeat (LRR) protein